MTDTYKVSFFLDADTSENKGYEIHEVVSDTVEQALAEIPEVKRIGSIQMAKVHRFHKKLMIRRTKNGG